MLKVVCDTNTLVSAAIARGNESRLLCKAKAGEVDLLTSLPIIKELEEVLSRRAFGLAAETVEEIVDEVVSFSTIIKTKSKLKVVKEDPSDDRILECAVDGKADYIISGDKHLLALKEYKGIRVASTREILEKLGGGCH